MDINDIMPPDWQSFNYTIANFDKRLLLIYGEIQRLFPGVWVNCRNGVRLHNWCGLRSPVCTIGAINSAHKMGKALDFHSENLSILRSWCMSEAGLQAGILRVEAESATPTWVHVDVMPPNPSKWKDKSKPYVFLP